MKSIIRFPSIIFVIICMTQFLSIQQLSSATPPPGGISFGDIGTCTPLAYTHKINTSAPSTPSGYLEWDHPLTWINLDDDSPEIPGPGAVLYIPNDAAVRYRGDQNLTKYRFIDIAGELFIPHYQSTTLNVETIRVTNTGLFQIGRAGNPLEGNNYVNINFVSFQETTGSFPCWDAKNVSRGLISSGSAKIRFYAAEKTNFVPINSVVNTNTTSQISTSNNFTPLNWHNGDKVVLPGTVFQRFDDPSGDNDYGDEIVSLTANASSSTMTTSTLEKNHIRIDPTEFDLHAANLTRNITFRSAYPGTIGKDASYLYQRGHIMFAGRGDVIIENVLFKDLGRTNKHEPLDDIIINLPPNIIQSDFLYSDLNDAGQPYIFNGNPTNIRGRYAVHFHQNNYYNRKNSIDESNDEDFWIDPSTALYSTETTRREKFITRLEKNQPISIVKGCVVWGTPGWGFVNHSSFVNFAENVCYNFVGSGFVTESGDEFGTFENNIAIKGTGDGEYRPKRLVFDNLERPLPLSDFGFSGDGFWFQGPAIRAKDNVAANCNGAGMIWFSMGAVETTRTGAVGRNHFIGFDPELADAAYQGIDMHNKRGSDFLPRTWNNNTVHNEVIADYPIMECTGFDAYGCLAGFRFRFCNTDMMAMFLNKLPRYTLDVNDTPINVIGRQGDIFGYRYGTFSDPPSPAPPCAANHYVNTPYLLGYKNKPNSGFSSPCDYQDETVDCLAAGDHPRTDLINATRLGQQVSDLVLWNNESGIRAKYVSKTEVKNVKIDNRLRYDEETDNPDYTEFYPGVTGFDGVQDFTYTNTEVNGYALAIEDVIDIPTPLCNFNATTLNNSLTTPTYVTSRYSNDKLKLECNTISTHFINEHINGTSVNFKIVSPLYSKRIGFRYKSSSETYWTYIWADVGTGIFTGINVNNLTPGVIYDYQLISGCEVELSNNNPPFYQGKYNYYIAERQHCATEGPKRFLFNPHKISDGECGSGTLPPGCPTNSYPNTTPTGCPCTDCITLADVPTPFDKIGATSNWTITDQFSIALPDNTRIGKLNPLSDKSLRVYPNPLKGNGLLYVDYQSDEEKQIQFSIYDAKGTKYHQFDLQGREGTNSYQLNVSDLPAGIYFISDDIGNFEKFIKS